MRKIITLFLAAVFVFSAVACNGSTPTSTALSVKTYTGATTMDAGETLSLNLSDYFNNADSSTSYSANVGTVNGSAFTYEVASGLNTITITATKGEETAVLIIAITGNVVADAISAKAHGGASGIQGTVYEIPDLSTYFNNVTEAASYSANVGTVTNKSYSLNLTEGNKNVEITATENDKAAKLSFTVSVTSYAELAATNKQRAVDYAKTINGLYWNSTTQLSKLTPSGGAPYLWPYTEQAAMANAVLEILDPVADAEDYTFMKNYLIGTLEGLRFYRVSKAGKPYTDTDFGVLSAGKDSYAMYNSGRTTNKDSASANKGDIYFDDNIWVAKEFYFAYLNLGEEKYLNECINILNWILGEGMLQGTSSQGEFQGKGMTGIYWLWGVKDTIDNSKMDDTQTASLNACSSAPTAMVLLKVAEVLENHANSANYAELIAEYRDSASKIVSFITNVLRRSDGLIRDKVFLRINSTTSEIYLGQVDEQVLGYNTGCAVTAYVELYKHLGAASLKNLAEATAATAHVYFANAVAVPGQFVYDKNSWFTSFLIDGYIDLDPISPSQARIDRMMSSLDFAWNNNRASDGLVSPDWVQGWSVFSETGANSEKNPRQILLQSANAHCYAMLARYYASK